MATLKQIRKRIASVKNTQKITKAMKMVAAAKLRRAQTRLVNARPYCQRMEELLGSVASLSAGHPLLANRESADRAEFLILTSDRGLCGGFNGNLLRRIDEFLKTGPAYSQARIHMIGKKGRDYFRARHREPASVETGRYDRFGFDEALRMAGDLIRDYQEEKFDHYYLVSNHFKSALAPEIKIDRLIPLEPRPITGFVPEYLYEPDRPTILASLLQRGLATRIYRAFLESMTAEFAARMAAMESATNNCSDMIYRLTLTLNRLRQAAITKELMDIVNGAEALK